MGRRRRAPAPEEEARNDRGVSARANPARSWGAAANAAPVGALLAAGVLFYSTAVEKYAGAELNEERLREEL